MAQIVVVLMDGPGVPDRGASLAGLRASGHRVTVVAPRWPECQETLLASKAALVVVDGASAPSHGRAAARWMATQAPFRTVPFLFLDVADKDVARVKKELPRAQFATWSGAAGASDRLVRKR